MIIHDAPWMGNYAWCMMYHPSCSMHHASCIIIVHHDSCVMRIHEAWWPYMRKDAKSLMQYTWWITHDHASSLCSGHAASSMMLCASCMKHHAWCIMRMHEAWCNNNINPFVICTCEVYKICCYEHRLPGQCRLHSAYPHPGDRQLRSSQQPGANPNYPMAALLPSNSMAITMK